MSSFSASERESSNKTPITQMMERLRGAKYVATRDEMHVLMTCSSRMRKYALEGFIAAGCALWTVTGRLNLLQRLIATVAGAGAGGFLTARLAAKPCMEDILSLEGSRLQEELVAVLQKHAHSTKIREVLQKYYYLEPLYDDKSQGMPSVTLRKRQSTRQTLDDSSLEVWGQEEDAKFLERKFSEPSKSATTVHPNNSKIPAGHFNKNVLEDDLLTDPVDFLAWTGSEEGSSKFENKVNASQRRQRRMNVIERREHNRMRYLLWKERQQQMQNEVSSLDY